MASPILEQAPSDGTEGEQAWRRITEFRPSDAAAVADMYNSSEEGWPGGFMRGVVMTPEQVLRDQQERQPLATFLSWEGDVVAGYCSFFEYPGERGVAGYVGLLNAATRFHGRGHGRDLLKAALRRSVELGYRRTDLHTWPGNMKAVPLYKKTGFFWVPDTDVHMENYLPLLLTTPALADFWAEADWYNSFVRELAVQEDLIVDGKMRVYPYEFRHGERFVRATIDATARGLAALETERWSVRCTVDDRLLIVGRPRTVRWEVENRTGRPLSLTLTAGAGRGLHLTKEETVTVHDRYTTEATLQAAADYRSPAFGEPAPLVETLLLLDRRPVRLQTGVQIRQPLEIGLDPVRVSLTPGVERLIRLRVRNAADEPITARLRLAPSAGLSLAVDGTSVHEPEAPAIDLALGPQGYAGAGLRVRAAQGGAHTIGVHSSVDAGGVTTAMAPLELPLPAAGPGEVVTLTADTPPHPRAENDVLDREVRVETATHRLIVSLRGGGFSVQDAQNGTTLLDGRLMVGPPFAWTSQTSVRHEATPRHADGSVAVILRGSVAHLPAAAVEHELRLAADGLLRLATMVTNMGPAQRTVEVLTSVSADRGDLPVAVLPTVHGLIATADSEFPDWSEEALRDAALYTEGWLAREGDGRVVGLMWGQAQHVEIGNWDLAAVRQSSGPLEPGARVALAPLYAYAGPGTRQTVRERWRSLLCPQAPRESPPARDLISLETAPLRGALLAGTAAVTLSSAAAREATGQVLFEAPAGWSVEPAAHEVSKVRVGRPSELHVTVRRSRGGPGAAAVRALLRTTRAEVRVLDGALLALGDPAGAVEVADALRDGQRAFDVDNSYLRFTVVPGFLGSVVSLTTLADGTEHVLSAFPEPRAFGWMRPWFGGLHPVVYPPGESDMPFPGRLHEEEFSAAEATEEGRDGRRWRGVAVHSVLHSRGLRGLEVRASYLTLPGSNLLAARVAVRNTTSAALPIQAGLAAYLQPGGTTAGVAMMPGLAATGRLLRAQRTDWLPADGWLGVRAAGAGPVAVLAGGRSVDVVGVDWGDLGAHGGASGTLHLGPSEERSVLCFLALARDEEEARAYGVLRGADGLP